MSKLSSIFHQTLIPALCCMVSLASAQSVEGWEQVFHDDFVDNRHDWSVSDAWSNPSRISNLKLIVVDVLDKGANRSTTYTDIDFNEDFIVVGEIASKGTAKLNKRDRSDYGLLVGYSSHRYKDQQGWYELLINFYKVGMVVKIHDANKKYIVKKVLKENEYAPRGFTKFGIVKKGETVRFFINDKEVFSGPSVETQGGGISFMLYRYMRAFMRTLSVYQRPNSGKKDPYADVHMQLDSLASQLSYDQGTLKSNEPSVEQALDQIVALINEKHLRIHISAHTDDFGEPTTLLSQSEERANLIRDILVEKGISEWKITAEGLGDLHPKISPLMDEARTINNRIEIKVTGVNPSETIETD